MEAPTVQLDDQAAPKPVGFDSLAREKKAINAKFDGEVIKLATEFLFTVPTFTLPAGTADHWPLTEGESVELTKRIESLLQLLPKKRKTNLMKLAEKFGPWVLFMASAGMITYPRIQLTREALNQQRRVNNATRAQSTIVSESNTNANGETRDTQRSGTANGNGSAQGNARASVTPLDISTANLGAL